MEPSEREMQALKVLWQVKELTVRDLFERINQDLDPPIAYTTVLSLLQVMEQKGMVGHRQEGKTYFYFPKVTRARTVKSLASGFLDRVFDGAVDEYVLHAIRGRQLSAEQLARIEALIAEAKAKQSSPKSGGDQ